MSTLDEEPDYEGLDEESASFNRINLSQEFCSFVLITLSTNLHQQNRLTLRKYQPIDYFAIIHRIIFVSDSNRHFQNNNPRRNHHLFY